jgi:UDP-N-acetylmuramyl pentapeptide phosphotransferase/UDP-N-acetylglucosamine-1-phosphate transferase
MGCLVWCLYPAKCRIGNTGRLWLSAEVTALSFLTRQYFVILLLAAVYLINLLPLLKKNSQHPRSDLQSRMQQAGMGAGERIGILACLAAICGGAAIMLIH